MIIRPNLTLATFVTGVALLAGCTETGNPIGAGSVGAGTAAEAFTPVTTEAAFRDAVVGREVVYDNGAIGSYGADNTWTVRRGDEMLAAGTWVWRDDQWCYGGRIAGEPLAPRCDMVEVSEAGVRFVQEDGTVGTLQFRS